MKSLFMMGKTRYVLRLATVLVLSAMTTSAWAGHKMIINKVTHQLGNGFVNTLPLPQPTGWFVTADQLGQLFQPHAVVETTDGQAAGVSCITLKNAKGKIVAEVEDKGILGAPTVVNNYQSFMVMFVKAGASDAIAAVYDFGNGVKSRDVTMSPATFGKGSQFILKFAGHFPEQTTGFVMNPSLWGDETQVTNIPFGSLGQVMYDELGENGGGQATITIDFELIEE